MMRRNKIRKSEETSATRIPNWSAFTSKMPRSCINFTIFSIFATFIFWNFVFLRESSDKEFRTEPVFFLNEDYSLDLLQKKDAEIEDLSSQLEELKERNKGLLEKLSQAQSESQGESSGSVEYISNQETAGSYYLEILQEGCDEICDQTIDVQTSTEFELFGFTTKDYDCQEIWMNKFLDIPSPEETPPENLPLELVSSFSYNAKLKLSEWYLNDKAPQNLVKDRILKWTQPMVDDYIEQAKNGSLDGRYGNAKTIELYDQLLEVELDGLNALVIRSEDSEDPWLEAVLLALGVGHVTTVGEWIIQSEHPQITTSTSEQVRTMVMENQNDGFGIEKYDLIVSYNMLQHVGMGRYGDALNPFGDVQMVAKYSCLAKHDAIMLIGVPYAKESVNEKVVFNGGRLYGPVMMPHLSANWKPIASHLSEINRLSTFIFERNMEDEQSL